jgi:cytochrome oxidase Cu insertion factor (SCO1/SenC/PrrC family)
LWYAKTGNRDGGKRKMRWGLRPILLMILVCASFLGVQNNELTRNQSLATQSIFQSYTKPLRVPEFSLEDLQGKMINIQDYKGRVILLNFWATW